MKKKYVYHDAIPYWSGESVMLAMVYGISIGGVLGFLLGWAFM
jgi:hypothetical protein